MTTQADAVITVLLPAHLQQLARCPHSVQVQPASATQRGVLDALEAAYPSLRGTIRDQSTGMRRAFIRFYANEEDLSHESPDDPLPEAVVAGREPFLVVGAMSGG